MQIGNSARWQQIRAYKYPLILALFIHLVFIFMLAKMTPAWETAKKSSQRSVDTPMINVSLKHTSLPEPKPEPSLVEPEIRASAPAEAQPEQTPESVIPPEPQTPTPQLAEKPPTQETQKPARLINRQQLHSQLIRQLQRNLDTNPAAVLGKFSSRDIPANWTRKAVDYTPGIFKAAELPTEAIILDNWKNPDGSMQNKIKLPNGDVICGRLGAHNPLDIYSMPIWMYQSC